MSQAAVYWHRTVDGITQDARAILYKVAEARRIYRANRLGDVVAALPTDEDVVPGTTMTRRQAVIWAAMVEAVAGFLATEVSAGFTIEDGLYAVWPEGTTPPITG